MKLKTVFYVGIAVSAGVFGLYRLHAYLFPPTDDAEVNAKLLSLKRGESIALADVLGAEAERVCWIVPSYSYNDSFDDNLGMLLGAPVLEHPSGMHDSEGGDYYIFVRYADKSVRYIETGPAWVDYLNEPRVNWCVEVKKARIGKRSEDSWWEFITDHKEIYNEPDA